MERWQINFRDEPLDDVFRKIGQVYNADIVVMDKDLAKHMYRATFQGETLDEILRLMKLTVPMKYIEKLPRKLCLMAFIPRDISK